MAKEFKSSVRLAVVTDDLSQSNTQCPDLEWTERYAKEVVLFDSNDINVVNKTFTVLHAYAFLDKFNGKADDEDVSMVGVVDFANVKSPEFAQFMYAYMLAQGIYCYAINIDASKAMDMKRYVQHMCMENDMYSEAWNEATSAIDFDDPSAYLLCGVVAARFDSQNYQTVIHVGDSAKPVDLFICSLLSCFDPISGNPVITKDSVRDVEPTSSEGALGISGANITAIILNL